MLQRFFDCFCPTPGLNPTFPLTLLLLKIRKIYDIIR